MDQIQIEPVAAKLFEARVKSAQRFVEAVIRIAKFRRHENVRAAEERLADALLVSIHRRRIDQAIAFVDRHFDHPRRLVRRRLKNAKSELRHGCAVIEGDGRLGLTGHRWFPGWAAAEYTRSRLEKHGHKSAARAPKLDAAPYIGGRTQLRRVPWGVKPLALRLCFNLGRANRRRRKLGSVSATGRRRNPVPSGGRGLVRREFRRADPRASEAWPAIKAGRHTLIAAPTGSGKTLAAFLAAIDDLVRQGLEGAARR